MGCASSISATQAAPASQASKARVNAEHPLIRAARAAADRGVSPVDVRAFAARMPTPPGGALEAAWVAWVDELCRWSKATPRPPLPHWPLSRPEGGLARAPCSIPETALRGITIGQLREIYVRASARCLADGWISTADRSKRLRPEEITLYDLNEHLILPETRAHACSMVELIADGPAPPRYFVSHWWGEPVCEFIECLGQHARDHKHMGVDENTPYWVCAYANNQHRLDVELGTGGVESSPFARALALADGTVSVVDRHANIFTRMWCAYEVYVSLLARGAAFAHDIYTARPGLRDRNGRPVPAVGLVSGYADTDWGFSANKAAREEAFPDELIAASAAFACARARASQPADAEAILAAIGTDAPKVDATVRARFGLAKVGAMLAAEPGPDGAADAALGAACADLRGSELRALSVRCEAGKASAAAVRALLSALPASLRQLNATGIGGGASDLIAERVRTGQLTSLTLVECALTPAHAAALGDAAADPRSALAELDLRESNLGDKGLVALARGLSANRSLTALNLEMNNVGDEGTLALVDALVAGMPLARLDLFDNDVGDVGARALAGALMASGTLRSLNLITNSIGRVGRAELEAAWARAGREPDGLQLVDGDPEGADGDDEEQEEQEDEA